MKESNLNQSLEKNLVRDFENTLYLFQNTLVSKDLSTNPIQEKTKDKIIKKIISENNHQENKQRILSEFLGLDL